MLVVISWLLFAFLLGAVPVGPVVTRYVADVELQSQGSGNIGATNVARVVGRGAGAITLLADALKGTVGALGGLWLAEGLHWAWACGVVAVLGHCFTPFLRWRGGKGVATSLGVLLVTAPGVALAALGVWLAVVAGTRRSSLGALLALPTVVALISWWSPKQVGWAVVMAGLVLVRHRDNVARLLAGQEHGLRDSTEMEDAD